MLDVTKLKEMQEEAAIRYGQIGEQNTGFYISYLESMIEKEAKNGNKTLCIKFIHEAVNAEENGVIGNGYIDIEKIVEHFMDYKFHVRLEKYICPQIYVDSKEYKKTKKNLKHFLDPIGKDLFLHIEFL